MLSDRQENQVDLDSMEYLVCLAFGVTSALLVSHRLLEVTDLRFIT